MKKVIKNWRCWLIAAVAMAAFLNLVGMPQEGDPNYWELFLYSKFTALALAYIDVLLYAWFAKRGEIDELTEYLNGDE